MRAEIWARPGAATFERIWEDPQAIRFSGTARMSATGDGEMQLPDTDATVELADKLLLTDPDTPGNSTRALVRVYADGDVGGTDAPLHEWRVESVVPPTDNSDPTWEVSGLDPFSFLDDAEVKPWDWDGTDDYTSLFPDWVWGGRNLLGELQSVFRPHTMLVWNTATGGTFKLGVSFDGGAYTYTANIPYNSTPANIDVELDAIGYTTSVTGEGTVTNPWRIQFMSPEGTYTIAQDVALLTGGTGYISVDEIGAELPRGWEESKSYVSMLNHGVNVEFRLSDGTGGDPALPACDTSGWSIMFNGTEPRFPGIQKPVKVKPGGIYQASVWVYAQGAGADVRLVIRDLFENGIAAQPDFSSGQAIPANTWTLMSLPNVTIPSNTSDVLFRVGHVGTGDPPKIFVACPQFTEGLAATTIGDIWEQLYADAVTNHSGVRVVWEDESATLPGNVFLTLGFTDAVDSDGAAWDDSTVSLTAKRGFSYGRVMKETLKLGYEARVVPVPATDGQWQLEIYNPGTLGTDYTGDDFVGIRVGREVIRKAVRRFVPTGTQVTVETGNQGFSHAANAAAITSLGRLEYYTPERDLGTLIEAGTAADALLAKALARGRSIQPVILPGPDDPTPFVDYTVGDTIDLDDPDEGVTISARLAALSYAVADDLVTYEPALSAETFVGSAAVSQGVRQLLEAQDAIRREAPDDAPDMMGQYGFGQGVKGFTIRVAASDAYQASKDSADFVCDGINDHIEINQAIGLLYDGSVWAKGRILLSEGTFTIGGTIVTRAGTQLHGMGMDATTIYRAANTNLPGITCSWAGVTGGNWEGKDFTLFGNKTNNTSGDGITWATDYVGADLTRVKVEDWDGIGMHPSGVFGHSIISLCWVTDNDSHGIEIRNTDRVWTSTSFENGGDGINISLNGKVEIVGCWIVENTGNGIRANGNVDEIHIVGNYIFENGGRGVYISAGAFHGHDCLIASNFSSGNGNDGIEITCGSSQGGYDTLVASNLVSDNGGWGIDVSTCRDMHVASNIATANTSGGINLGVAGQNNTGAANRPGATGGAGAGGGAAGADSTAIHDDTASEISAIAAKAVPTTADYLIIEDAAAANVKKSITLGDLPAVAGIDSTAIHDNVASEISAIAAKAAPVGADMILIEDSEAGNVKKMVTITNLPGGADADAIHDNVAGEIAAIAEKVAPVGADMVLIEDSEAADVKKMVQITNLPGGADADAIHDNVAGEIAAVAAKGAPVGGDYLLIEDSEAANAKKSITLADLPGGASSPLTTKGDLWGFAAVDARVPIGTDTHVLTADSGEALGLKWAAPSAGGTVGAEVRKTGNQSVNNTTWAAISWDAEEYDDNGFWAAGNPTRITFADAGRYLVIGNPIFASNGTGARFARIIRNGNQAKELALSNIYRSSVASDRWEVSAIVNASASDYIEVEVYQNSGGALNIEGTGSAGDDVETTRLFVTKV